MSYIFQHVLKDQPTLHREKHVRTSWANRVKYIFLRVGSSQFQTLSNKSTHMALASLMHIADKAEGLRSYLQTCPQRSANTTQRKTFQNLLGQVYYYVFCSFFQHQIKVPGFCLLGPHLGRAELHMEVGQSGFLMAQSCPCQYTTLDNQRG